MNNLAEGALLLSRVLFTVGYKFVFIFIYLQDIRIVK